MSSSQQSSGPRGVRPSAEVQMQQEIAVSIGQAHAFSVLLDAVFVPSPAERALARLEGVRS